jgi:hypothetical protein
MRNATRAINLVATLPAVLAGTGFIWPRSLRPRGEVTRNTGPRMVTASDQEIAEWNRNLKSQQVLRRLGEHSSQPKRLSFPTKG